MNVTAEACVSFKGMFLLVGCNGLVGRMWREHPRLLPALISLANPGEATASPIKTK